MNIELGSEAFWQSLATAPAQLAVEVCRIDLVNLDLTLQQHAALYAWVAATHEVAAVQEERAKWAVTRARASATLVLKALPDEHTQKAKAISVLAAEVDNYEAVQTATLQYLAAQEKRGVLQAMTKALMERSSMLIQLSVRQREEHKVYQ